MPDDEIVEHNFRCKRIIGFLKSITFVIFSSYGEFVTRSYIMKNSTPDLPSNLI